MRAIVAQLAAVENGLLIDGETEKYRIRIDILMTL